MIAFDARMSERSGIGSYVRNLLAQFAAMDRPPKLTVIGDQDIHRYWRRPIVCRSPIYSIQEQLSIPVVAHNCNVFHAPHYNAPLLFRGRLVVTIHDLNHLTFYDELPTIAHKLYARLMMTLAVRRADHIMTDSEWTRRDLLRRWPDAAMKTEVVHNGIDPQLRRTIEPAVPAKYGITKPYVLYLGLLKRHKNITRLIEAFLAAQDELKGEFQLAIAGDPTSDDIGLRDVIVRRRSSEIVRLIGFIAPGDIAPLYSGATAFAFPSLAEGFGLPPLEAMACGTPVIASNASCLPEVLGGAPRFFDPRDVADMAASIVSAVRDEAWRFAAIERGYRTTAKYRWEDTALACLRAYSAADTTVANGSGGR